MAAPPAPENETSHSAEGGVRGPPPKSGPSKRGGGPVTQQFQEREGADGISRETSSARINTIYFLYK